MADREKVIKGLECCAAISGNKCRECPYGYECRDTELPYGMPHLAEDAIALLKEQETIVRCKDCKYSCGRGRGMYCQFIECEKTGAFHKEDWFCADGERKEGR